MESLLNKKTGGRRKIPMEKIPEDKVRGMWSSRSKRKETLFKKAAKLKELCGVDVAVLVQYPRGKFYSSKNESEINSLINQYLSGDRVSYSGDGAGGASNVSGWVEEEFYGSISIDDQRPIASEIQGYISCVGETSCPVVGGSAASYGRDQPPQVVDDFVDVGQMADCDMGEGFSSKFGTNSSCGIGGASNGESMGESMGEEIKDLTAVDRNGPSSYSDHQIQGCVPVKHEEFFEDQELMDELSSLLADDASCSLFTTLNF
ncbi:OLC1v1008398C1 [Oldenlandia corymbosa var. corymbosa]|uniref:OLC1v1008398C1 n=1 Tax=Oldenlandia corymbosa var. corymbosa TaxID=529605 RepID=A0AAV1DNY4_OLDCO|nr:OLC1v1008398C1 [Oldenlandia corymbosa var. corymbosa]